MGTRGTEMPSPNTGIRASSLKANVNAIATCLFRKNIKGEHNKVHGIMVAVIKN